MTDDRRYWFPAKTYGWGWGIPATWQGWVVIGAFIVLLIVGSVVVLPRYGALAFEAYTVLLVLILVLVCWRTGEPPRWRWGDE